MSLVTEQQTNKSTTNNNYTDCQYCGSINKKSDTQCIFCNVPTSKASTELKYQWRIPSMPKHKKYLLFNGYIKMNYTNHITADIIHLCCNYYTNDPYTLNDIKNITATSYQSPIISIHGLKWYFELLIESDDLICKAHMVAFPQNVRKFNVSSLLIASHNPKPITAAISLNKYSHCIINERPLKLCDITNLKQLNFDFEVTILAVFDEMSKIANNYFDKFIYGSIPISLPSVNCTWNISNKLQLIAIKNAKEKTYLLSPIYSFGVFKFCLKFYPNLRHGNCVCYLAIFGFPKDIKQISVHGRLELAESKTICFIKDRIFTIVSNSWGWTSRKLKYDVVKTLLSENKTLTLRTQFTVNEVYKNEKDIIPNFVEQFALTYPKVIQTISSMFKWKICNLKMLRLREPDIDEIFAEKVIETGLLKWHIVFVPKPKKFETAKFMITLSHFPANLSKLWIAFRSNINQINEMKDLAIWFDTKHTLLNWPITITINDLRKMDEIIWNFGAQVINATGNDIEKYLQPFNINECVTSNKMCQEFIWQITDEKIINEMKYAANVMVYTSPIFILHGLKFFVSFYPNGSNSKRINTYNIFLKSVGITNDIESYFVQWEVYFIETDMIQSGYWMIDVNNNNRGMVSNSSRSQNSEALKDINSFRIKVKITMIDEIKDDKCKSKTVSRIYEPKLDIYSWCISYGLMERMKCAVVGQMFDSGIFDMFGMKWYISCFPAGVNDISKDFVVLCINNVSLPDVKTVLSIKYKLFVEETKSRLSGCCYLDYNRRCVSWDAYRISTETFKTFEYFTIKLEMSLIDMFDDEKDMNSVSEVENMSVISKENEFKLWIYNVLRLPEYYDVFVDNGVESLEFMKFITIKDLERIGVKRIEHKSRILMEVIKLNL